MEYKKTLSEILEIEIRKQYKSTMQFAEKNNIPYTTIMSVINRGVEKTTVGTLANICDALNISIDYLFSLQKFDTLHIKLMTSSPEDYSDEDLLNDLIESKIIVSKAKYPNRVKLLKMAKNYRNLLTEQYMDFIGEGD